MKNKGFTLIELLAVITIMGILLLVGIPSINRVIENSRKDNYIDTAKKYTNAVKRLWVTDQLFCGDNNITSAAVEDGDYYILIDSSNFGLYTELLEQGGKSSWGNRDVKGYVRVNVKLDPSTGKQELKYYVALSDKVHAIYDDKGNAVEADDLVRGNMVMSLDDERMEEIEVYPFTSGNVTTCSENSYGNSTGVGFISMVNGNKDTIGSEVKIGTEFFYIYGFEGDNVKLLAKYNLYVGYIVDRGKFTSITDSLGIQSEIARGYLEDSTKHISFVAFSATASRYAGSNVQKHINNYNLYLTNYSSNIVEVRAMDINELIHLGCSIDNRICTDAPAFTYSSSYWVNSSPRPGEFYGVLSNGKIVNDIYNHNDFRLGVRPVVIMPKSEL